MDEKKQKLGPVSAQERRDYRARFLDEPRHKSGRPTAETADNVWALVVTLSDLLPKSKGRRNATDPESALTAKQSLVVALDCAITAGEQRFKPTDRETRRSKKWLTKPSQTITA